MLKCETCRFWLGYESQEMKIGECRRFAPRPISTGQVHGSWHHPVFVHMIAESWCGEHQPKDTTP